MAEEQSRERCSRLDLAHAVLRTRIFHLWNSRSRRITFLRRRSHADSALMLRITHHALGQAVHGAFMFPEGHGERERGGVRR